MRFAPRPRRALPESIIPMINVVFLLLIFFLLSARLTPPPPVKLDLPQATSDSRAAEALVLYLTDDGVALGDLQGDAAWQLLAGLGRDQTLTLRADARHSGTDLAKILARLAHLGITQVELAVRAK